jgi:serine/threonine protein kinase
MRLGRFHLVEPIGGGPCGEVFRAKVYGVAGFERQFAVKRLYPSLVASPRFAAGLSAAARAYGGLEHPRIAKLAEFGVSGGDTFTATELCDGVDAGRLLDEALASGRKLPAGAALSVVSQAARAIGYAHGRGVSHLGLAPTNLLISDEGNVRVTDIGILGACLPEKPAHDDRLAMRIHYLAPEQLVGDATSPASDVFVLGAIACELVSGQRAFGGDSPVDVAQAILAGAPLEPELPRPLLKVLQRCLARAAGERYPDARALADAIDAAQRMSPVLGGRADLSQLVSQAKERRASIGDQSGAFTMNLPAGAVPRTTTMENVTRMERPSRASSEEATETTPFLREDMESIDQLDLGDGGGVGAGATINAIVPPPPAPARVPTIPSIPSIPRVPTQGPGGTGPQVITSAPKVGTLPFPPPVGPSVRPGPSQPPPPRAETEPIELESVDLTLPAPPQFEMAPLPAPTAHVAPAAAPAAMASARNLVDRAAPSEAISAESTSVVRPLDAPSMAIGASAPAPRKRSLWPAVLVLGSLLGAAGGAVGYVWWADGRGGAAGKGVRSTKPAGSGSAVVAVGSGSAGSAVVAVGSGSAGSAAAAGSGSDAAGSGSDAVGSGSAVVAVGSGSDVAGSGSDAVGSGSAVAAVGSGSDAVGSGSAVVAVGSGSAAVGSGSAAGSAVVAVVPTVEPGVAGRLKVTSTPPGALVLLDGAVQGNTPIDVAGSGDTHTLALVLPGHALHLQEIKGEGAIAATLTPLTPTGAPAGIKIRCKAPDRYYVFVDGRDTGMVCPTERIDVTLGSHVVEIYDLVTETRRQFPVTVKETRNSVRVKVDAD